MSELIKRIVAATGVRDWQAYQMLEAIREPTPHMVHEAWIDGAERPGETWLSMIDTALQEARDGK